MQKERFNFKRPEIIRQTEKDKRSKSFSLKPLVSVFYIIVGVAVCYFLFFSGVFSIKKIEISGIKSMEISDYMKQQLIGRNILLLRTGKFLYDSQRKFPSLSEVRLVRGLPETVKLVAKERNQVMIICSLENCFQVDNYGYAYQKIPKPKDKVVLNDKKNIKINEGERVVSESFIAFFLDALDEMNHLGLKVKSAEMEETTFKITFVTKDGFNIITDSSYSLKNQISALTQVIEKSKGDIHEYIDVRVEGVAYIK
ncbi:MAG: hypothetical protein ABH810_03750 [bacterium]